MPCFSVLSVGPAASLAALSRRAHTYHENGEVAEVVAAAEHLGRRGLLCATALRAPEPPVALAGSLLPEDTGHVVAFLRGDAGVGCIPGVQGRDQGLEIVGAKDDSTAPLSTFYQVLAGLCHQAAPDSSPASTMDSESDLGKPHRFSEPQFIHLQNGAIYTKS